ncbi:MAG: SHOCT domain-containing protein [Solirubrobacteraceae bacterium]|nr:SHOCT domain-containing protein [Solirubrobacteraceae bacterium]
MGLGKLFGRGNDDDEGIGIPGAGDPPLTPTPVVSSTPSPQVHVTSQTVDVSDNPQAVDAVMDMLKSQGIDISAMTGGATIQMGQPMDPAVAEKYRQNMLGMLDSMGIDAPAAAFTPVPGAGAGASAVPAANDPGVDDVVESLERLAKLRDAGALTPAEFEAQKARILGGA